MLFNTLALFRARVFYFKVKSNNYIQDYNSREAKNRIPATFKIFGLTIIIYEILRKVVAPTIISCLRVVLISLQIESIELSNYFSEAYCKSTILRLSISIME